MRAVSYGVSVTSSFLAIRVFTIVSFVSLIRSESGYALNDPEHRHAADGVGRQNLQDG